MMNYDGFGVVAVKAIQEQQMIIDAQNERITSLENEINEIREILKTIKQYTAATPQPAK